MKQGAKSWSVSTHLPIDYSIVCCDDLFSENNPTLLTHSTSPCDFQILLIDEAVYQLYAKKIHHYFDYHQTTVKVIPVKTGESNKNLEQYQYIIEQLNQLGVMRRSQPVLTMGGGVLTDLSAFATSTFRRGIPHIKIPTTLMGYIDAAIGIKNGINYAGFKNRLGTFSPPKVVYLDRRFLATLPKRHVINGIGEILKIAIIKDESLFQLMKAHGVDAMNSFFQCEHGELILHRAIESMRVELEPNLFEEKLDRVVDFGHTFTYALEMLPEADLLHGEAVVIDILISTTIAHQRAQLSYKHYQAIVNLIFSFPYRTAPRGMTADILWRSLIERTQHRDGLQRVPVPTAIGESTFLNDIKKDEINQALHCLITMTEENYHHVE